MRSFQTGDGDRDPAADQARSYSRMLMVEAPLLFDSPVARAFLDQAQRLAREIGRSVAPTEQNGGAMSPPARGLDDAIQRLPAAAAPLLATLTSDERSLVQDEAA